MGTRGRGSLKVLSYCGTKAWASSLESLPINRLNAHNCGSVGPLWSTYLVAHRVGGFEQQNLLKAEFSDATEPPASFDCKLGGKLKIKLLMNSA